METVAVGFVAGVRSTLELFWDSLFGLILGFLISAVAQVTFSRAALGSMLGTGVRGVVKGAALGIVASACSYGAAAAARGLFAKGADIRAVLSFLISSTNMNVAIVILFWTLLGWKFAFAEFAGGAIIIAIVTAGFSLVYRHAIADAPAYASSHVPAVEEGCEHCHHDNATAETHAATDARAAFASLLRRDVWRRVLATAWGDVLMLRTELAIGFLVAGFAAALVPAQLLAHALRVVGAIPVAGYLLLLLVGLALAVVTFVCSMGNVPIARYLAMAGIPLGANTTFIYGDLLVPPLISIYRKSFPPNVTWTFIGLFVLGALVAGATMDALLGGMFGGMSMGSMTLSDRVTLVSNIVALAALLALVVFARTGSPQTTVTPESVA